MLTYQHLNRTLFICFVIGLMSLSIISCGDKIENREIVSAQIQPEAVSTKQSDERFLVTAAEMSLEEVLLGKLAQTRAASQEVKDLGKLLEEANRERKSTIASLGIMESIKVPSVPPPTAHASYDTLNLEPVESFEAAYLQLVIQNHHDAIQLFESASRGNVDPDIQKKANELLPAIREHLSRAIAIETGVQSIAEVTP